MNDTISVAFRRKYEYGLAISWDKLSIDKLSTIIVKNYDLIHKENGLIVLSYVTIKTWESDGWIAQLPAVETKIYTNLAMLKTNIKNAIEQNVNYISFDVLKSIKID